MRWLRVGPVSLILLATFQQISCSGVFELRLKSFVNANGKDNLGRCCSGINTSDVCGGMCRTRFRVCLKHYQTHIDTTSPCTYGDKTTPVLGENSVLRLQDSQLDGFTNPIRFPLNFTWPGTFSLIVEALHDTNATGRSNGTLITRLAVQRYLSVGEDWTEDEYRAAHTVLQYEYRVRCDPHYYGSGCANFCRPRDDSFGHYTCSSTGDRVCVSGWEDDYCTKARCLPGCDELHGHCYKPDECLCQSGWKGALCDQCQRYPGCLHGTCHEKPWECLCDEGWGGLFCNQDLNYCTNHKPCLNGGTCFNTGQGSYTCSCPEDYTGTDCEREIDVCAQHPCLHGGTCRDNGTTYKCECPKGWHGRHCETSAQSCNGKPCHNGGTCQNTQQGYSCRCPAGYEGFNCEQQIDKCSPNPCKNGGSCVDIKNGFECICLVGFTGDRCDTNIDDCKDNPCMNGGTCIDLVNEFKCQCVPGYVGNLCQSTVNYCLAKPCANGGECRNLLNDYQCTCRPGFSGKDCSVDIDECEGNPCRNGGTCINRVNEFQCQCPHGFGGRLCDGQVGDPRHVEPGGAWVGNISRHVSDQPDSSGLSTEHVVVIATLSTAVPVLVLVAAIVVMCMKQRRKRAQQEADEEARMQNEQNTVSSMTKRCTDTHMIKNTWGYPEKCVNNVLNEGNSDCFPKENTYTLQRTKSVSHKQLNTDPCHRTSVLNSEKLQKDFDNLCSNQRTSTNSGDRRISVLLDSSLCNTSDTTLISRSKEKDCHSIPSVSTTGPNSSVYVIPVDEHFQEVLPSGILATEV